MAVRKKRLTAKSWSKLKRDIESFLLRWSEFQSALTRLQDLRKAKFRDKVFNFFATSTDVPTVDDLANLLSKSIMYLLDAMLSGSPCREAAERILDKYNAHLAAEDLKALEISREPSLTFNQSIDIVLSEWEDIQIFLYCLVDMRKEDLVQKIFHFLLDTDEPGVDDLVKVMQEQDPVDHLVDFSNCKMAAEELLNIYQSCVDDDLHLRGLKKYGRSTKRFINTLGTIVEEDEC